MKSIRNAAKAIIIENGMLLAIKIQGDEGGIYYILPGGGQEFGETLYETLKRECREEIGCEVEVGDLVLAREYQGWNHEFAESDGDIHAIEFMFICSIKSGFDGNIGSQPDAYQIGVEWIEIEEIEKYPLYPKVLKPLIISIKDNTISPVYLGDVN